MPNKKSELSLTKDVKGTLRRVSGTPNKMSKGCLTSGVKVSSREKFGKTEKRKTKKGEKQLKRLI